ncbi:MAG: acetolactate decarboxylase [Bacteroidota bacterium]
MRFGYIIIGLIFIGLTECNSPTNKNQSKDELTYPNVEIVGAMKNVMWQGRLGGIIDLDTISTREGLYGLGPLSYLKGEILINDGKSYVSKVVIDSSMIVEKTFDVSAPFFVYGRVIDWSVSDVPEEVKTIQNLEEFIDKKTVSNKRPFVFKLTGRVANAIIHIQNLPEGTQVSSPSEAHQGQVKYAVKGETVEIIGFFSTEHKGIFTHHDSFVHMHLITIDEQKMGHLDELEMEEMKLYLPVK